LAKRGKVREKKGKMEAQGAPGNVSKKNKKVGGMLSGLIVRVEWDN